jgi:hypothetical protein
MYVYLPSAASGTQIDLIQSRDTANRFRLRITPTSKVAVVNGTSNVGQSTASITFDAWVRVELKVVVDASAGSMEARFYLGDSTTAVETVLVTALNTGTVEPTSVRLALPIAVANIPTFYFDDLAGSNVGWVGPWTSGAATSAASGTVAAVSGANAAPTITGAGQVFTWSAEGGTSGNTVTTGSLVGGDTAPATASAGVGGVLAYSAVHPAHGTMGVVTSTTATLSSNIIGFDTTGWGLTAYVREYIYLPSPRVAVNLDLIQIRDTLTRFRLRLTSGGKIAVVNGSTVVATSSASFTFDAMMRVELGYFIDPTAGWLSAKFYNGDSTTEVELITAIGLNTGTTEATSVRFAIPIAATNIESFYLDDLA